MLCLAEWLRLISIATLEKYNENFSDSLRGFSPRCFSSNLNPTHKITIEDIAIRLNFFYKQRKKGDVLFCFTCQCFAHENFNTALVQRPAV